MTKYKKPETMHVRIGLIDLAAIRYIKNDTSPAGHFFSMEDFAFHFVKNNQRTFKKLVGADMKTKESKGVTRACIHPAGGQSYLLSISGLRHYASKLPNDKDKRVIDSAIKFIRDVIAPITVDKGNVIQKEFQFDAVIAPEPSSAFKLLQKEIADLNKSYNELKVEVAKERALREANEEAMRSHGIKLKEVEFKEKQILPPKGFIFSDEEYLTVDAFLFALPVEEKALKVSHQSLGKIASATCASLKIATKVEDGVVYSEIRTYPVSVLRMAFKTLTSLN